MSLGLKLKVLTLSNPLTRPRDRGRNTARCLGSQTHTERDMSKQSELEKTALTKSMIANTEDGRTVFIEVGPYKNSAVRVRSIVKKLGYHFIKTDGGYEVSRENKRGVYA